MEHLLCGQVLRTESGSDNTPPPPPQVHQWLEKVFSGEEVPEYEINSQTVDRLYRMAQDSEAREREAETMIEDFEQKAEEYASESECTRGMTISDCIFNALVHVVLDYHSVLNKICSNVSKDLSSEYGKRCALYIIIHVA